MPRCDLQIITAPLLPHPSLPTDKWQTDMYNEINLVWAEGEAAVDGQSVPLFRPNEWNIKIAHTAAHLHGSHAGGDSVASGLAPPPPPPPQPPGISVPASTSLEKTWR